MLLGGFQEDREGLASIHYVITVYYVHLNFRHCNCVEQRLLWEASSSSDSQEIVYVLWNLKAHYHVHRSLPFVSVLRQINPVQ